MLFRFLDIPHLKLENRDEMLQRIKPVALLIYLACQPNFVTREALTALFADDSSDTDALRQVRVLLSRARKYSWASGLELEQNRLRFAVETDVQMFRVAIGAADWQLASELYKSEFLTSFRVEGQGFEAWVETEREVLRTAWSQAAINYARMLGSEGQHGTASTLLRKVLATDEMSEDILAAYLEHSYLAGMRNEALQVFDRFQDQLTTELGLEPLQSTLKLVQTIRQAAPLEADSRPDKLSVPISVLRPPTMIGRDTERYALETALKQVNLVSGEPGAGKTRMLEEVIGQRRWLKCLEGLENLPYQAVIAFLRLQLEQLPDLGVYTEDLARLIPELLPNTTIRTDDPISAKVRTLEALARCFETEQNPVVIDDLQWADAPSLEFFQFLVSRGQIRIYGTYRSSEVSPALAKTISAWRSSQHLLEIKLEPLKPESINALLASMTGVDIGPPRFSAWLTHASGGNPFFALETLKALFETDLLHEKDGIWQSQLDDISFDYNELRVPTKVATVIEQRISRLSEAAKRALQAACVMRQGFTPKTLAGIVGLSEFAVLDALEEAQNSSLIATDSFLHDLIRQSVYQSLPDARRKFLHGKVASILENVGEPLIVAEHWFIAEETKRAVDLWVQSIAKLRNLSLYAELIRVCTRILENSTEPDIQHHARRELIAAHIDAGDFDTGQSLLERGLQITSQPQEVARLLILQAELQNIYGQPRKALETLKDFATTPTWFDEEMKEDLHWNLSSSYSQLGQYQEALELLEVEHVKYEQVNPTWKLTQSLTAIGSLHDRLGNHEQALNFHQRALQTAQSIGHLGGQISAMRNLIFSLSMLGRSEEGFAPAEALLQTHNNNATSLGLRSNLATTYLRLGRFQEAKTHYEKVIEHSEVPQLRIAALGRIAEVFSALGIHEQVSISLDTAMNELTTTEHPTAQGIVAISVFKHGDDFQVARIESFLETFDIEAAQPDVRVMLTEARKARQSQT